MSLGYARSAQLRRRWIEFVREDAHGNRDGDAFGIDKPEFVFPIEAGARKRHVRQPGDRDVVEDVDRRVASLTTMLY